MATSTSKAYTAAGTPKPVQQQQPVSVAIGGGGGGGGGGGSRRSGGGGKSSSKPDKDAQKDLQATVNNLGDIYGRKKKQLEKDTKAKLGNIDKQIAANNAEHEAQKRQIATQVNWQPQQQKEQSTLMALRNRMGNSAYGSALTDLQEGMGRVDDMADVELINTHKMNLDNAYNNWYQANSELVADYNSAASEADSAMADLLNQYQAALNNVSPQAASTKNIKKASKAGANTAKAKAALKNAKAAYQKAAKAVSATTKAKQKNKVNQAKAQYLNVKNNPKASAAQKTKAKQAYAKAKAAYKKVVSAAAANKAAIAKNKANEAQVNYTNAANRKVTGGSGDKKVTLRNIDLSPSDSFNALIKARSNPASANNPDTVGYIRPDAAAVRGGSYNTAGNANSAFADNLLPLRSPVQTGSTATAGSSVTKAYEQTRTVPTKTASTIPGAISNTQANTGLQNQTAARNANIKKTSAIGSAFA